MTPSQRTAVGGVPRVEPVSDEQYRHIAAHYQVTPGRPGSTSLLNITKTWAHHPALMQAQRGYQLHLRNDAVLPRRDQEIAVLRVGWRCGSAYEFGQHAARAAEVGLSHDDLRRLTRAADSAGGDERARMLVQVVDELYDSNSLTDATWAALSDAYNTAQVLELLVLIGRYWTVSVVANTLGIQLEPGKPGFPDGCGESGL